MIHINKKSVLIFVAAFILLFQLSSVFAQSFNFDFRYGGSSGSVYNSISRALDIIFGSIIRPIFEAIAFNNFEMSVRVALWIILFIIFSHMLKEFLSGRKMDERSAKKFSKVIGAIIALLGVAFIPLRLLEVVFRNFLGGLAGYFLILAVVLWPLYQLYKFSKSADKAANLAAALGFLLMTLILSYLHDEFIYAFDYGMMQNIASLTVTFGIVASVILMIHRLIKGFRSENGNREDQHYARRQAERNRERSQQNEERAPIIATGNNVIEDMEKMAGGIHNLSRDAEHLAFQLASDPSKLDCVSPKNIHDLSRQIQIMISHLQNYKGRNSGKARQLAKRIDHSFNQLQNSSFNWISENWRDIHTAIRYCQNSGLNAFNKDNPKMDEFNKWFSQQHNLGQLFANIEHVTQLIFSGLHHISQEIAEADSL